METTERDSLQIFFWTNWLQDLNKTINKVPRHKILEYWTLKKGLKIWILRFNNPGI